MKIFLVSVLVFVLFMVSLSGQKAFIGLNVAKSTIVQQNIILSDARLDIKVRDHNIVTLKSNIKRLTSGFHVREMELLQQIYKLEERIRSGVLLPRVLQGLPQKETDNGQHNQTEART